MTTVLTTTYSLVISSAGLSMNSCKNRLLQSPSSETPKRITKKDFGKAGSLKTAAADPNDPLSQLDPLWSLK